MIIVLVIAVCLMAYFWISQVNMWKQSQLEKTEDIKRDTNTVFKYYKEICKDNGVEPKTNPSIECMRKHLKEMRLTQKI